MDTELNSGLKPVTLVLGFLVIAPSELAVLEERRIYFPSVYNATASTTFPIKLHKFSTELPKFIAN